MTLLIKNVQILGSDQKLPDKLDVFVSGEKIAAIGRFPGKRADEVIEGQGMYLSPGFIDVDTESDHYLSVFTNPSQEDFLKQGVTTIIGGFCGASLSPLIYGSLEALEEWTRVAQVNVDWHSTEEFLKVLSRFPLGVNFGTLTGHSTLKQALVGQKPRDLTKNELKVLEGVLERSIKEGSFGLSTGLGYTFGRDTPYGEISALSAVVKRRGGVYATHLRSESGALKESIDENLRLIKETGVKILISHLMPVSGYEEVYEQSLNRIDDLGKEADFHFTVYPFSTRVLKLYTFLPTWAQKGDLGVMNLGLEDEWLRSKIFKELPEVNPKSFVVAQASGNDALVGHSLSDLKKMFSLKSYSEALLKLMVTTRLQAIVFYENINFDLVKHALRSSKSLVASNAASFRPSDKFKILKPERATATFTRFLELAQAQGLMPLEEAIRKITFEPARKFGLERRGLIKDGYFADLVGFRDSQVNLVVVNGQVALRGGEVQSGGYGKVLKFQA